MHRIFIYSCLVYSFLGIASAQILYQCNYDTHTIATGCLLPVGIRAMLVSDKAANPAAESPTAPLSDVTSSRKHYLAHKSTKTITKYSFSSHAYRKWTKLYSTLQSPPIHMGHVLLQQWLLPNAVQSKCKMSSR